MMKPVAPMLAVAAEPFDSPEHLFEIKWDGVRGLALVEQRSWRLWGRGKRSTRSGIPNSTCYGSYPGEPSSTASWCGCVEERPIFQPCYAAIS